MATYWTGRVSVTDGSNIVEIDTSDENLNLIIAGSALYVAGYDNPVIVQAVESSLNRIILDADWPGQTDSNRMAIALPSVIEGRKAVEVLRDATDSVSEIISSASVGASADTLVRRDEGGRVKTANASASDDAVALGQFPDGSLSDLYGRFNILGTVSQSGGAPTGAIIERDSNDDGEYVRFADGTQICQNDDLARVNTPSASGFNDIFRSVVVEWEFPVGFSSRTISYGGLGESGGVDMNRWVASYRQSSASTEVYRVFARSPSDDNSRLGVTAIGRWF